MKVTERLIAGDTLTNTVYDRLLNVKARHKQSLLPFMTFPWLEGEIPKFRWIDCENDWNHTVIASSQD